MSGVVQRLTIGIENCRYCLNTGGRIVWANDEWRVIGVDDVDFPVFYRLVPREHVEELSMLTPARRAVCVELICAIEGVLLKHERPASINLAAFGNVVPHLHWHVIARFAWDSHFPEPVWGARQRTVLPSARDRLLHSVAQLDEFVCSALSDTSA